MSTHRTVWQALASLPLLGAFRAARANAQSQQSSPGAPGQMMLTIFLRHDQSKTLEEINQELESQGYYAAFPPAGVEIVSWYVMMGIGQVVTLKLPASRLREVNRAIEQSAWGGYRTEFYPTYDYKAVAEEERRKNE